jgi:CubicO group peptidase (beta-lactamase class C family)
MRTLRPGPARALTIFLIALLVIAAAAVHDAARAQREAALPRATPEAAGMSSERLQAVTALLGQFVADRRITGAVGGVVRRGKVVYLQPVGLQNFDSKAAMTEASLFRVYSMTKAVTAVAVMMLVEEARLRLADPVSKYLPEFRNIRVQEPGGATTRAPARAITVEDLLLHTSGLSHRTSELYRQLRVRSRSDSLARFITNITQAPLLEDPGTRFRYSEGTTVLGRVVEVVAAKPFDDFVADRILRPLGMNDTSWWVEPNAIGRLVTLYQRDRDGALTAHEIEEVPFTQKPALIEGAVGLVSTAIDFLRFGQMLLNKGSLGGVRLLAPTTVEAMTRNGLSAPLLQGKGGTVGWGLANVDVVVGAGSRGYLTAIGEYGWDGSAGTFFAVDPSRELVVTLMTQNLPANPDGLRQKFKAAVVASIVE